MTAQTIVYFLNCSLNFPPTIHTLLNSTGLETRMFNDPIVFLNCLTGKEQGCLILDVRMPKMSGLQMLAELKRRQSGLALIFLTDCQDITIAIDALKKGAVEYITSPYSEHILLESIYSAIEFSKKLVDKSSALQQIQSRLLLLTKREYEILEYIMTGMINKMIATELHISSKTVEMHRANLMHKMEVMNVAELISLFTFYKLNLAEAI